MKIFKNRSESPLMSGFIPTRQPWPLLAACVCACSPVAQADPYSTEILSDNPLAYYRFDDGVATDDRDAAANLGSLGAAARAYWGSTTTRSVAGALTADANTAVRTAGTTTSAMSVPYQAGLNVQGSFSVEAWLKIPAQSALSPCVLSSLHAADPRAGWTLIQGNSSQGFRFRTYNKNGVNSALTIGTGTIAINTWYHVVAVWDDTAKVAKIYQNGVLKATSSAVVPVAPATRAFEANADAPLTLGMMPDSTVPWSGDLDEVAYYPAALTLTQVQAHYTNGTNAGRPIPYQDAVLADAPAGYWRLGEGPFVPRSPLPVAANAGSLGTTANGAYNAGSRNTASGPNSAGGFPGFGTAPNSVLALESAAGFVGTAVSLLNNRTAYTVCGWVKRGAVRSTRGGFFGQNDLLEFGEAENGGKLEAWTPASGSLLNPSGLIPNYPFVNNAWGFVCVTGNASRATLYFDGVQAATWAGNASLGTSAFLFNIGGGVTTPTGDHFLGEIDEVAVFDQAFSAGRVRTLYDTALGGVAVELTDAPTIVPGDSVPEGQRYTLTAASPLRGSGPFTYRWFADDAVIAGATGRTYTVASAVVPAGGGIRYAVEIDNDAGDPVLSPDTYVTVSPMLVWDGRAAANPTFWDVATTANWVRPAGGAAVAYDDTFGVLFNDAAASGTVAIQADVAPPTLVFDNATLPYTVSSAVEGVGITGVGALTKKGPGTVTLAGNHTFTGGTLVNAGLLKVGDGTTGSLAGAITLAGGNLDLNLPAAATFPNATTIGAGSVLTVAGTGNLTWGTTLTAASVGGLVFARDGQVMCNVPNPMAGPVTINKGTVVFDGNQVINRLANGHTVTVNGPGKMAIWGVNALPTGANSVNISLVGGTLELVSGGSPAIGAGGDSHIHGGNLTLNGGTILLIYSGGGTAYNGESIQLNADLLVTGASPSTIAFGTGATTGNAGLAFNGARIFNVEDVTNSPAADLSISAELENRDAPVAGDTLTKTGAGTLLLQNGITHSFTGTVTVAQGTLAGTGSLAGSLVVNATGTLAPGEGVGTLATGNATITGTYLCQLDGASADKLTVTGSLNLTGSTINFQALSAPTATSYLLATCTGTLTGTPAVANLPDGYALDTATPRQLKLVKAGTTFAAWIATYNLTGNNALPAADPDRDGIPNAVEMVLGGNPKTGMDAALMPTIELVTNPVGVPAGNYLLFAYRRADQAVAANLTIGCEYATALAGAWTPAQAPAAVILTDDNYAWTNPAAANTDRVRVYVPRGSDPKLFGRLKVTVP